MHLEPSRRSTPAPLATILLAATVTVVAGCGERYGDVAPPGDSARRSLEASLNAWRQGKPPGAIDSASPPVRAVDDAWQRGARLAGFEILREELSEGEKWFAVRLDLEDPSGTKKARAEEVRYVVLGRDPVWVFREEDYRRSINMDEAPRKSPSSRRKR